MRRKLILNLSMISLVATPLATVVSCTSDFKETGDINLVTMKSNDFVDELLKRTNLVMKHNYLDMMDFETEFEEFEFDNLEEWFDSIVAKEVITVDFGSETFDFDFIKVDDTAHEIAEIIRDRENAIPAENLVPENQDLIYDMFIHDAFGLPEIIALGHATMGSNFLKMYKKLLALTPRKFDFNEKIPNPDNLDEEIDNPDYVAISSAGIPTPALKKLYNEHPVNVFFTELHKVIWSFVESTLFEEWNIGMKYEIPMVYDDSLFFKATLFGSDQFDDPSVLVDNVIDRGETSLERKQLSNIEAIIANAIFGGDELLANSPAQNFDFVYGKSELIRKDIGFTGAMINNDENSIRPGQIVAVPKGYAIETINGTDNNLRTYLAPFTVGHTVYINRGSGDSASKRIKPDAIVYKLHDDIKSVPIYNTQREVLDHFSEFSSINFEDETSRFIKDIPEELPETWKVTKNHKDLELQGAHSAFVNGDNIFFSYDPDRIVVDEIFKNLIFGEIQRPGTKTDAQLKALPGHPEIKTELTQSIIDAYDFKSTAEGAITLPHPDNYNGASITFTKSLPRSGTPIQDPMSGAIKYKSIYTINFYVSKGVVTRKSSDYTFMSTDAVFESPAFVDNVFDSMANKPGGEYVTEKSTVTTQQVLSSRPTPELSETLLGIKLPPVPAQQGAHPYRWLIALRSADLIAGTIDATVYLVHGSSRSRATDIKITGFATPEN